MRGGKYMKATTIISMPIINLYSGRYEGTVSNICFDKKLKLAKWLVFFDDNSEEDKAILTSKVNIGKNAIIIKNNEGIFPLVSAEGDLVFNNPINLKTYDSNGNLLGKVTDIELNNKFVVENIFINEQSYNANQILSASNDTIILNLTGKKIKLQQKTKIIKNKKPVKVVIQPIEKLTPPIIEEVTPTGFDKSPSPIRILSNHNYLIGRRITKNIYGSNNEIIAKKDSLVTTKNLEWVKQNNKVIELAICSKVVK